MIRRTGAQPISGCGGTTTPRFDSAEIAYGLALGCHAVAKGLNLARELRPRESVFRLLPLGQMAVQVATMATATVFLQSDQGRLDRELHAVQAAVANHAWMKDQPIGGARQGEGHPVDTGRGHPTVPRHADPLGPTASAR